MLVFCLVALVLICHGIQFKFHKGSVTWMSIPPNCGHLKDNWLNLSLAKANILTLSAVTEREMVTSMEQKILHCQLKWLGHLLETPWTDAQLTSPKIRCQDPNSSSWMGWVPFPGLVLIRLILWCMATTNMILPKSIIYNPLPSENLFYPLFFGC